MMNTGLLFAYFSPETLLPMTSVIASAAGVFLLFGRGALRVTRRLFRATLRRVVRERAVPSPHFTVSAHAQAEKQTR